MKQDLLDLLICPNCLPLEIQLACRVDEKAGGDIQSGWLECKKCGFRYPIQSGVARLVPSNRNRLRSPYETPRWVAAYLWSHYADLWKDPDSHTAYREWAERLRPVAGPALDTGCSVGRFTFELGRKAGFTVGIDLSEAFVSKARELMTKRRLEFIEPIEGLIGEPRILELPGGWDTANVEFIVGDVQALPFPANRFFDVASLNMVDKVPLPLLYLKEMNRVAKECEAQVLLSDPFSWSTEVAQCRDWLGGDPSGPYPGRGFDNLVSLMTGGHRDISPPWRIEEKGELWWKIRNHQNHFELIRSSFIKASR